MPGQEIVSQQQQVGALFSELTLGSTTRSMCTTVHAPREIQAVKQRLEWNGMECRVSHDIHHHHNAAATTTTNIEIIIIQSQVAAADLYHKTIELNRVVLSAAPGTWYNRKKERGKAKSGDCIAI